MAVLGQVGFGGSRIVMSLYALELGANQATVGVIIALYSVCPLLLSIWMGRLSPSQHNTTSPDMVFNSFSDGPTPKRPKNEPPPEAKPNK